MKVDFIDARTSRSLWSNDALSFREEYDLTTRRNTALEGVGVRRSAAQLLRSHRHRRRAHRRDRHPRSLLVMPPLTRATFESRSRPARPVRSTCSSATTTREKSAVATEFTEMVDEGLRAFNVDRLFGGEIKADDLFDAAATLPMMAPRRIVIVCSTPSGC